MRRQRFIDKVFSFTREKGLFSAPCHVLLGLSGGADSMALLHVLTHWPEEGLLVTAVHIHHGLRGEYADKDAQFVREYCLAQDIPLVVLHEDVASFAKKEQLSVEEAGRVVRYRNFDALRIQWNADYVVTAHTASDQVETVLMHMVRGCGTDGLAGIPACREYIRRPLLGCSRSEIEEYCRQNAIPYVEDETNTDTQYMRNDIRHRILPMLRQLNPSVDDALLRLSDSAAMDSLYLRQVAETALQEAVEDYGYRRSAFVQQPSVVRRRMIRSLYMCVGLKTIEESHIVAAEQMLLSGSGSVSLPGGYRFSVEQGIAFVSREKPANIIPESVCVEQPAFSASFGEFLVSLNRTDGNVHELFENSVIDYDRISGNLYIRARQMGDYMHPAERGIGKSLKKLMNEWKIPVHLRDGYPLLCDDKGVVLVPGYACDERVRVTEHTNDFLVCKTEHV